MTLLKIVNSIVAFNSIMKIKTIFYISRLDTLLITYLSSKITNLMLKSLKSAWDSRLKKSYKMLL